MLIVGGAFILTRDYMSGGAITRVLSTAFGNIANSAAGKKQQAVTENATLATKNTTVANIIPKSKTVIIYKDDLAGEMSPTETLAKPVNPPVATPVATIVITPANSPPLTVKPTPAPLIITPVDKPVPAKILETVRVAVTPVRPANSVSMTAEIKSETPAVAMPVIVKPAIEKIANAQILQQETIISQKTVTIKDEALAKPPISDYASRFLAPPAVKKPEVPTPPTSTAVALRDCATCPELAKVSPGHLSITGKEIAGPASPAHEVVIKSAFAIGRYEVTFEEWDRCVAEAGCTTQPSDDGWGRGRRPVINVSFNDINSQYLPWLSRISGKTYRLPTDDEWEFAARGGASGDTSSIYFSGNDAQGICKYGNSFDVSARTTEVNVTDASCSDGFAATAPVGSFKPNARGLFDMQGNVWEWVSDCWRSELSAQTASTGSDCKFHVLRGGAWSSDAVALRADFRGWEKPDKIKNSLGFRIVRSEP